MSGAKSAIRRSPITLLDGGMGTTLESLGHNVSSPLWGCDLLQTSPGAISDIHDKFVASGAELVETATYQLTLPGLVQYANVSDEEAKTIMRSAVHLAYTSLGDPKPHRRGVVLALGPYGATLRPGQEYAGMYPPPFGPPLDSTSPPTNYLGPGYTSEQRLAEFHYDRLLVFALDQATWSKVNYIAFETIPLLREIRAVRQAIKMLRTRHAEKVQLMDKEFWICSAFPGGEHPQLDKEGGHVSVEDVLEAMVGDENLPVPDGVGVNCTNPSYLPALVGEFTSCMERFKEKKSIVQADQQRHRKPATGFVLYPDGGCTYDVVSRKWTEGRGDPDSWAKSVAGVARGLADSGTWGQVIVGGCCKAGFEEIAALRAELDRRQE